VSHAGKRTKKAPIRARRPSDDRDEWEWRR
jgi:hypothetical protein